MATISSLGIGSGLNLNGLLDQLASAERQQLEPIKQQQQSYRAEISAFGKLESALSALQDAAAKLADESLYTRVDTDVTGGAVSASATSEATVGSYQVEVGPTARAYSIATTGVADSGAELGAGTVTMTLGNGDTLDVDIVDGQSSLVDVRDAINAVDGGVRASIVNDGGASPYRLVLAATETGTDAAIASVDFGAGGLAGSLALDNATEVAARNAQLTVNGIDIQSQGNTVEDAIQGVTLEVAETGSATVDVGRDRDSVIGAVDAFVQAYNNFQKTSDGLTSFDAESGRSGELLGNGTLRSVESRLRGVMGGTVGSGAFDTLSDIGITRQLDGTLDVDDELLTEAIEKGLPDVAGFLAGDDQTKGFAARLNETLERMLDDRGLLDNATRGLDTSIENLEERYQRTERSINATIARYREQFSQLDGMIASMNSMSSYLTQQFDNMNAQLGRK